MTALASEDETETMDIGQQKEQFSIAYVRAVAATGGFSLYKPEVDDDSIDHGIGQTGGGGTIRSPKFEFQLKCASRESGDVTIRDEDISYRLKLKNYEELRVDEYLVPRLLVVVFVPNDDVARWLAETEEVLAMNSCGYWVSLRGEPRVNIAGDKTTIRLPRAQLFNVEQVTQLLTNIGNGLKP